MKHLHTYVFLTEILHRLRDLLARAADDGDRAADGGVLHDGDIGKDDVERDVELARHGRNERLGYVALHIGQAHDQLARLKLHDRGVFRNQLVDLAEVGGRVDEVLGDILLRGGKDAEYLALLDHTAVLHDRHTAADLLDDCHLMRDQDDRDAERFIELPQQPEDGFGGLRVERRGRLVAQQHIGVVGKRPCDGNALLLSAGELLGIRLRLVPDADQLEQPVHLVRDLLLGGRCCAADTPRCRTRCARASG